MALRDYLYEQIRAAFIEKIPFEAGFFMIQGLEMLHLRRSTYVFAGEYRPESKSIFST